MQPNLPNDTLGVPEPPLTFIQKFQQRIAESRYFMLSCVIHAMVVIIAGSLVLYRAVNVPEFIAEGGDGMISAIDDLPPPAESRADAVPPERSQTPKILYPSFNSPTTTVPSNVTVAPTQPRLTISMGGDIAKPTGDAGKMAGVPSALSGALRGRQGVGMEKAKIKNKMQPRSEVAVLKGLAWLQQNQNPDGSWGDGNKGAMTGFALLCFLGHGETPASPQFGLTVNKAVQWILDNGTKSEGRLSMTHGSFPGGGPVYEHAICAYALGEYYTMTQDEHVKELFKQAIGYIVQGQGPGGGWMYSYDKTADDLSVSGWQIQALKAAHLSKLDIYGVDQALDKAMAYIERVKGPKGGYGYRGPEDRYSLTGVGILCELFWKGDIRILRKGMDWMLDETEKNKPVKYKSEHADLYAWYYHTQACLMFGGVAWKKWNRWFQDEICDVQNTDGSWPAPGGKGVGIQSAESKSGQVYRTTLCILMLEVFYRYMPTTQG